MGPLVRVLLAETDGNPDDAVVAAVVEASVEDSESEVAVVVCELGSTVAELVVVLFALLIGIADVPVPPAGGAPPNHAPLHAAVYP